MRARAMNKESGEKVFLGGAFVGAVAASLCCILPVLAIAFGLGAFGVASVFETLRPYLLAVVVLALAFSFYHVYFRREKCGEGEACSTKPIRRFNQIVLWVATIAVLAIAAFPYYTSYVVSVFDRQQPSDAETSQFNPVNATENPDLQNKDEEAMAESESQTRKTVVIVVEGMTCESCTSHINIALKRLGGVISAEASYPKKNVTVVYDSKKVTVERIRQGIRDAGYDPK